MKRELAKFIKAHKNKIPKLQQRYSFKGPEEARLQVKNPILHQPCYEVTEEYNSYVPEIIEIMDRTMSAADGIGIAANQIGVALQIFLIEAQTEKANSRYGRLEAVPKKTFVNPVITRASDQFVVFRHGCLSAKGYPRGLVASYEWISYRALNEDLKEIEGTLSGLAAIIFQHEFRHLLGGLYLDHQVNEESPETSGDHLMPRSNELIHKVSTNRHLLEDYILGSPIGTKMSGKKTS